ncbi:MULTISPECIES: hypothetical protein [unclassified Streptomyces]|uniref:hypothetical protein n=1 Tax=unclassified Streptomyces TaxID=2593676 RepID=UPI000887CF38|nr:MULTISPECIES: hypothetical protein [unclassified Streptomyces]PBC72294.1 hypothetical protein BX261_7378 [Streptomyces sp. 2321.6]SDR62274.1 hypothetical protein SAMN05216511_7325 [Streptomyces sp. KS_16]SEE51516.1 hypothetical protein SAMN05428940_7374 [Streptomyces sp. 2133.1]SNC77798.1 hypothetical protein SAMN06272741_7214 [Streptomyces sp. 2114.4]
MTHKLSSQVLTALFGHIPQHVTEARDDFLTAKNRWRWAQEELRRNNGEDPEWTQALHEERTEAFRDMRTAGDVVTAFSPSLARSLFNASH